MNMLNLKKETPLPEAPARVPLHQLTVKEAVGIGLWNGSLAASAEVYLARARHPSTNEQLARFLGGTAVPTSTTSTWNQSLIWMQGYLQEDLSQEAIAGYQVFHRACYLEQSTYQCPLDPTEISKTAVPCYESHGLLPINQEFLNRHSSKLVRYSAISSGIADDRSRFRLANRVVCSILKGILESLAAGNLICKVEVHTNVERERVPVWFADER